MEIAWRSTVSPGVFVVHWTRKIFGKRSLDEPHTRSVLKGITPVSWEPVLVLSRTTLRLGMNRAWFNQSSMSIYGVSDGRFQDLKPRSSIIDHLSSIIGQAAWIIWSATSVVLSWHQPQSYNRISRERQYHAVPFLSLECPLHMTPRTCQDDPSLKGTCTPSVQGVLIMR